MAVIDSSMANRPTSQQMEALVEFLEQNPGIARGLRRKEKKETKRKWQEFAATTNALGGVVKDGNAWAEYWAEMKSELNELCQQRDQTGGGVDFLPELSPLEQRLVTAMGGVSYATRTRGVAVDPFPESHLLRSPSKLEAPSTSQALDEDMGTVDAETPAMEQVPNPLSPEKELVDGSNQQSASFEQSASRRAPRFGQKRRQNRRVTFLDTQVRRFEEIESRRVEAEYLTAQALNQIAVAIVGLARLFSVYLGERQDRH